MSIEDTEVNALRRLGLTEYEARAYLVLGKVGPTKASEISFFGRIPRTKTYGAIKELERKGLLRVIPGKPELYMATPPNDVLMPLIRRLNDDVKNTETVVQNLALAYETGKYTRRDVPYEAADFWHIRGRPAVFAKLTQMIDEAKESIHLVTTGNGLIRAYKAHSDALDKARRRNVNVSLMATVTPENATVAREFSEVLQIRKLQKSPATEFAAVDLKELMFIDSRPDDLKTDRGADTGIWTTNQLIVQFHKEIFDQLWPNLTPLESGKKGTDR